MRRVALPHASVLASERTERANRAREQSEGQQTRRPSREAKGRGSREASVKGSRRDAAAIPSALAISSVDGIRKPERVSHTLSELSGQIARTPMASPTGTSASAPLRAHPPLPSYLKNESRATTSLLVSRIK